MSWAEEVKTAWKKSWFPSEGDKANPAAPHKRNFLTVEHFREVKIV